MAEIPNYYRSLGLDSHASEKEIRSAYRRKVKDCHPDVSAYPGETGSFRAAREAYEVLSDPARRKAYDAERQQETAKTGLRQPQQAVRTPDPYGDIELVLNPDEAARGGRFRIPLQDSGCFFCSSFRGFSSGLCPFCGSSFDGAADAVLDLPPGIAHGTSFVLDDGTRSILISVLVEEY
ncbi:DnaJ domain-containing protein [Marispirochaeta sp.]|jgi:DnaJ-class molecular chaperone|uniref:J domain-containing protein n=1 Tax=Marispirochaeta sp. TaxID=2038653 RepID=UPI0029C805B8|nr:DnaJ domain-containing protein [Marispirochaeta sp.]